MLAKTATLLFQQQCASLKLEAPEFVQGPVVKYDKGTVMLPEFLFDTDLPRYADLLRQHIEFLQLKTQIELAKAQTEFNRVQAFAQRQIGARNVAQSYNGQKFNFSPLRFHSYTHKVPSPKIPATPSPKAQRLSKFRGLVLVNDRPQVGQSDRIEID